ncbi:MAG: DUF1816 domain-containing protein [Prochlorothrix sp.]|nr:DUF1816 domain-containing protein [Prochlorothrix sp.]
MKEFLANVLHRLGQAYWVEITTSVPQCIYYFGPFFSAQEAQAELGGYVEDLEEEGATGIVAVVKRCKPTELTIAADWEDWETSSDAGGPPAASNSTSASSQNHQQLSS